MANIKILNIQPQNLPYRTPQQWRSWLNDLTEWQHELLHNHKEVGGEHYRYPLVQYRHNGFLGINEGETLLMQLLPLLLAETQLKMDVQRDEIRMLDTTPQYSLYNWQPFHAENYLLWQNTKGLIERIELLQKILTGHILGFCRAIGFAIPDKSLKVKLIGSLKELGYKKFSTQNAELWRLSFDIAFEANIQLPQHIGLGKGVSKGKGVLLCHTSASINSKTIKTVSVSQNN
ncbi:CRISPR-associated endonuclease Cas6 [Emticicia soli]|uniref:CRISPR-associated endonuclease Cas6 n=1 Tax=Emticicia soli TaxID=2027878 RepID=A0ABW5J5L5_9BACT